MSTANIVDVLKKPGVYRPTPQGGSYGMYELTIAVA